MVEWSETTLLIFFLKHVVIMGKIRILSDLRMLMIRFSIVIF